MIDDAYANIRQILSGYIGRTIVDITQHDEDEFAVTKQSYVMLMFDDGKTLRFPVGDDGFDWESDDEEVGER